MSGSTSGRGVRDRETSLPARRQNVDIAARIAAGALKESRVDRHSLEYKMTAPLATEIPDYNAATAKGVQRSELASAAIPSIEEQLERVKRPEKGDKAREAMKHRGREAVRAVKSGAAGDRARGQSTSGLCQHAHELAVSLV